MTKGELEILNNLQTASSKGMRSRPTLRALSKLHDAGLIEYDPFSGTAKLTATGEIALRGHGASRNSAEGK